MTPALLVVVLFVVVVVVETLAWILLLVYKTGLVEHIELCLLDSTTPHDTSANSCSITCSCCCCCSCDIGVDSPLGL